MDPSSTAATSTCPTAEASGRFGIRSRTASNSARVSASSSGPGPAWRGSPRLGLERDLAVAPTHGTRTFTDASSNATLYAQVRSCSASEVVEAPVHRNRSVVGCILSSCLGLDRRAGEKDSRLRNHLEAGRSQEQPVQKRDRLVAVRILRMQVEVRLLESDGAARSASHQNECRPRTRSYVLPREELRYAATRADVHSAVSRSFAVTPPSECVVERTVTRGSACRCPGGWSLRPLGETVDELHRAETKSSNSRSSASSCSCQSGIREPPHSGRARRLLSYRLRSSA